MDRQKELGYCEEHVYDGDYFACAIMTHRTWERIDAPDAKDASEMLLVMSTCLNVPKEFEEEYFETRDEKWHACDPLGLKQT